MKKISVCLFVLLFCLFSACAYSWYVDDYSIAIDVGKNGVHSVTENYTVDYTEPHHGFYRYIPLSYSDAMDAKVKDVKCSDYYSSSVENGWYIMQIGSASVEYTGVKDYEIAYKYDLGSDLNDGYDEFYFNLLGTDWDVPFNNASYRVKIDLPYSQAKVWVTAGLYGNSAELPYNIEETDTGFVVSGRVSQIPANGGITLRIQMPDNWYENARSYGDVRKTFSFVSPFVSFFAFALAAVIWLLHGRDDVPIISAKFDPPEGFSPLMVGYIADGQVDDKDITSMLYYWADKGLITINEKKKNVFSFTKIFDISADAPEFEQKLFEGFFKGADSNNTVSLKTLERNNFFECISKTKLRVGRFFTGDKALMDKKNTGFQLLCFVLGVVAYAAFGLSFGGYEPDIDNLIGCCIMGIFHIAFTTAFLSGFFRRYYVRKSQFFAAFICVVPSVFACFVMYSLSSNAVLSIVTVVCAALCAFFGVITQKRSVYGNKVFEDVLGYREFIDKVSMSQLIMLIDKNPEYYYHVLSYAIVLGLENKWAKKFADVATVAPSWYIGTSAYDVLFYSRMSSRLSAAVRTSAMTGASKGIPSSNGHVRSSFNFSGFAGGGFGGGGGRGW